MRLILPGLALALICQGLVGGLAFAATAIPSPDRDATRKSVPLGVGEVLRVRRELSSASPEPDVQVSLFETAGGQRTIEYNGADPLDRAACPAIEALIARLISGELPRSLQARPAIGSLVERPVNTVAARDPGGGATSWSLDASPATRAWADALFAAVRACYPAMTALRDKPSWAIEPETGRTVLRVLPIIPAAPGDFAP